jgi:hypothetical protein
MHVVLGGARRWILSHCWGSFNSGCVGRNSIRAHCHEQRQSPCLAAVVMSSRRARNRLAYPCRSRRPNIAQAPRSRGVCDCPLELRAPSSELRFTDFSHSSALSSLLTSAIPSPLPCHHVLLLSSADFVLRLQHQDVCLLSASHNAREHGVCRGHMCLKYLSQVRRHRTNTASPMAAAWLGLAWLGLATYALPYAMNLLNPAYLIKHTPTPGGEPRQARPNSPASTPPPSGIPTIGPHQLGRDWCKRR